MTMPKPWLLAVGGVLLVAGFALGGLVAVVIELAGALVVGLGNAWSLGWRPSELRAVCSCDDLDDDGEAVPCAVHG